MLLNFCLLRIVGLNYNKIDYIIYNIINVISLLFGGAGHVAIWVGSGYYSILNE